LKGNYAKAASTGRGGASADVAAVLEIPKQEMKKEMQELVET
jgi:hypothetical protein